MTVFGLGNPTTHYARTRHNIGFMVVDELAARLGARFRHLPGRQVCRTAVDGHSLILVKPLLYMNQSGVPVAEQLGAEPDDFIVVCDDIALPFGRLRLRGQGSDGGQKGLASIIYQLGTERFPRLRVGIGSPPEGIDAADHVLEPFSPAEAEALPELVDLAADACLVFIRRGLEVAMNRFNPEPVAEEPEEAG